MSGRHLPKVLSQTLTQTGYLGRSAGGSIRPVIDLVPGVLGWGAEVSNHHVLMEMLEPCIDHHRMHCIDIKLGAQRSRRVPNRSSDRGRLLIREGVNEWRVPVGLDKEMPQRDGHGSVDQMLNPHELVAPHNWSDEITLPTMTGADGTCRVGHARRLRIAHHHEKRPLLPLMVRGRAEQRASGGSPSNGECRSQDREHDRGPTGQRPLYESLFACVDASSLDRLGIGRRLPSGHVVGVVEDRVVRRGARVLTEARAVDNRVVEYQPDPDHGADGCHDAEQGRQAAGSGHWSIMASAAEAVGPARRSTCARYCRSGCVVGCSSEPS
jgi:hypothetical protein